MIPLHNATIEAMIPILAISLTFAIPVIVLYYNYQHKKNVMNERRLMIEKGLTPPPMQEMKSTFQRGDSTSRGMNMIAVALGLLVGYLLSRYFMIKGPFAIFGSILFFLGMANIISSTILKSNSPDSKKIDHE